MTERRFEKLVNLYLDKEISAAELYTLKEEVKTNLVRREAFQKLCKLHAAEKRVLMAQAALKPVASRSPRTVTVSSSRFRGASQSRARSLRTVRNSGGVENRDVANSNSKAIPIKAEVNTFENRKTKLHWTEYGGMAACAVLIFGLSGAWFIQSQEESFGNMPFQVSSKDLESEDTEDILILDESSFNRHVKEKEAMHARYVAALEKHAPILAHVPVESTVEEQFHRDYTEELDEVYQAMLVSSLEAFYDDARADVDQSIQSYQTTRRNVASGSQWSMRPRTAAPVAVSQSRRYGGFHASTAGLRY